MRISDLCQHRRLAIAGLIHDDQAIFDMEKELECTCNNGGLSKIINRGIKDVSVVVITIVVISSCHS